MVVISLFDGLSGGRIALERTSHLNVFRYYSSEIDKYAMQVAEKNYPQDIPYRLGSVVDVDGYSLLSEIRKEFGDVKILLIGGSPCQGFSMAGKLKGSSTKCGQDVVTLEQYLDLKQKGFEFDGQSYLFWEYIRIKEELNPDYFMLENVRVSKKWLPMFNDAMGVEPTRINSRLVSAQNRDRYYWHNFGEIPQPEDKGIVLKDILEDDYFNNPVIQQTPRGFNKGGIKALNGKTPTLSKSSWQENNKVTERPCELKDFNENSVCHHIADAIDIKGNESIKRIYADSGKSPTLTTCQGGHREPKVLCGASRGRYIVDGKRKDGKMKTASMYKGAGNNGMTLVPIWQSVASYRKLTPLECERLQTVTDGYTSGVSNSQRYKMIGNGWTIDVVAHLFSHIKI